MRLVIASLWLHVFLCGMVLAEKILFGTIWAMIPAAANVLQAYFLRDSAGGQLLSPVHMKRRWVFYYVPMERIRQVSPRLWREVETETKGGGVLR